MEMETIDLYYNLAIIFCERLKGHLKERLVSVVLYGSTARGEIHTGSDIDILIIAKDIPSEYHDRIAIIYPIVKELYESLEFTILKGKKHYPRIEYIIRDTEEARFTSPLDFDLSTDAKILFDNGFFSTKMKSLKDKMTALGSRKVMINDKCWYWDLKPDHKIGEVIEI